MRAASGEVPLADSPNHYIKLNNVMQEYLQLDLNSIIDQLHPNSSLNQIAAYKDISNKIRDVWSEAKLFKSQNIQTPATEFYKDFKNIERQISNCAKYQTPEFQKTARLKIGELRNQYDDALHDDISRIYKTEIQKLNG